MARLHTNVLKWGTKDEGPNNYKHGRRGALDDAYWDEDELVDFPKPSKYKKKKKRGCPGNDGKAHVYVWETITRYHGKYDYFNMYWVQDKSRPFTVDQKTCCGCGKIVKSVYHW